MNTGEPYAEYKYLVNGAFYQLTIKNSTIVLKGVYCDKGDDFNFYFIDNPDFVTEVGESLLHCYTDILPCNVYKMYVEMEWESITVSTKVSSQWKIYIKPSKQYIAKANDTNPFMSARLDVELTPLDLTKEAISDDNTFNALTFAATSCVVEDDDEDDKTIKDIVSAIDDTQPMFNDNSVQEHPTNVHSQNVKMLPESPYVETIEPSTKKNKKSKKKKSTLKTPKITYARQILALIRHVLHNSINKANVNVRDEVSKVVSIYQKELNIPRTNAMKNIIENEIKTWEETLAKKKQNGGNSPSNKKYVKYRKSRYLLRSGERGGKYIIVDGKKVYVSHKP